VTFEIHHLLYPSLIYKLVFSKLKKSFLSELRLPYDLIYIYSQH
jgi:hypothetical protein